MEIKYTKKEIIDLIKIYYKEFESREVTAKITSRKGVVGIYEDVACITTIKVAEKINLLGQEKEVTEEISQDRLLEILNALLVDKGYRIKSLSFDDGLYDKTIGYGLSEHTETSVYFKGINIYVEKINTNQVILKKECMNK